MAKTIFTHLVNNYDVSEEIVFTAFINSYLREFDNHSVYNRVPKHDKTLAEYMKMRSHSEWIKIELAETGLEIYCALAYYSLTGRHGFKFPVVYLNTTDRKINKLDVFTFANLLIAEILAAKNELLNIKENTFHYRLKDTRRNLSTILNSKSTVAANTNLSCLTNSFIQAEQSLLLGHSMHPLAKNRLGFSVDDFFNYSPEFCNGFQLFYFLAHPDIVVEDSTLRLPASASLKKELLQTSDLSNDISEIMDQLPHWKLIPVHPWQAKYMLNHTETRELIKNKLLIELGCCGKKFLATSSVRTVYAVGSPFMLKLSLNVQVTNAERINLPKELYACTDVSRLFASEWGKKLRAEFPDFIFILDPAFITLKYQSKIMDGFSTIIRNNLFSAGNENVTLAASLCQDAVAGIPNRLTEIIKHYANLHDMPVQEAAKSWFSRYLDVLLDPVVKIYNTYGLAIEAHQQNILLGLNAEGFPEKIYFRDNQGYFIRNSFSARIHEYVPGFGEKSGCIIPDEFIPAKYVYYLLINNILGFVNTFGRNYLIDEKDLIILLHAHLKQLELIDSTGLVAYILHSRDWEVKANLRMRLEDLNEDRMPSETPAVFINYANPLLLVEHFSEEIIYPEPGKLLFSKEFINREYTLSLRAFDFDSDFEVVYDWVNRDYAKRYWQMNGTRQYLEAFYIKNSAADYTSTFIGFLNDKHAFLIEPYWPMRDPVGKYYNAWKGDYGFHILMKPPDGASTRLLINAFRTALEYMFTLPKVQRVIGEADSKNVKLDALTRLVGYKLAGVIAMPEKDANLTICTRESYCALFPETAYQISGLVTSREVTNQHHLNVEI